MRLPESYHNRISYGGTIISAISLTLMLFVFLLTVFFNVGGSYSGLLLYMALPAVLFIGLLLIPIGMFFKFRRIKKTVEEDRSKKIIFDFNNSKHRNAAIVFVFGTFIFLLLTSVGSYEAFHYTESNEFCGTLCHDVMSPEYTTYQTSAHARVKCVECHVGSGADWYVKSKMSGLYQVYAVLTDIYPRPIPTPITSLRPARETCEQCHWPEKFYSNRIRTEKHFLADSLNSQWDIAYRMKIGPEHSSQGNSEGIHWHINSDVKIEYIDAFGGREYIPWVKYINLKTGDTLIYQSTEDPLDEEDIQSAIPRTMDCMDCHNRPSHQFLTPQDYIDQALANGTISSETPEIKFITMQIFNDPYDHLDTALLVIEKRINDFYQEKYPDYYRNNSEIILQNIQGVKNAYASNSFPTMKADWDSYPVHTGHIEYDGCFRCHDDLHVAENGNTISKDCNLCHALVKQGPPDNPMRALYDSALKFEHPVKLKGSWQDGLCSECHRYLYM